MKYTVFVTNNHLITMSKVNLISMLNGSWRPANCPDIPLWARFHIKSGAGDLDSDEAVTIEWSTEREVSS